MFKRRILICALVSIFGSPAFGQTFQAATGITITGTTSALSGISISPSGVSSARCPEIKTPEPDPGDDGSYFTHEHWHKDRP